MDRSYEHDAYEVTRREVKEFIMGTEDQDFGFTSSLNEEFMRFYDNQTWDEKLMIHMILQGVAEHYSK